MTATITAKDLSIIAPLNARFQFGVAAPMPSHNGLDAPAPAVKAEATPASEVVLVRPRGLRLPHGA